MCVGARMSRADVKRMRGAARIYSLARDVCARNGRIYTSADYSGVYIPFMRGFNEAKRVARRKIYRAPHHAGILLSLSRNAKSRAESKM